MVRPRNNVAPCGRDYRRSRRLARLADPRFYLSAVLVSAGLGLIVLPAASDAVFAAVKPIAEPDGACRIYQVIDGDTVELSDSSMVRLVGIQAPKLPLGRPGFKAWPYGEEARIALEQFCLGKRVGMRFGGRRVDFNGRRLAHLFVETGGEPVWLQRWMIAEGHARVYSFDDNRSVV